MSIRRERKDAIAHHQLILQTAKALFNEHGVHLVSMHQIAKTAGIGQATLYRRYAHKGDLCFDILQDYAHKILEQMDSYLKNNLDTPAIDRLGAILDLWIDAVEDKAELIIEMESKMNCEDDRGNFFHSPVYRFIRDKMSGLLAEIRGANSEQQLTVQIDPDLTAHAIICSLSPVGYFHIKQEKGYTREQMKQGFRQLSRLAIP